MSTAAWLDPELVARGREPMHAVSHEARLLLDGTWRFQLLPRPDAVHRGVGTASCGPDTIEEYLVRPGDYRWEWSLEPIA